MVVGLFICLVPKIFPSIDPSSKDDKGGASGAGMFLWPLCFMLGFVSIAVLFSCFFGFIKFHFIQFHYNFIF